MQYNLSRLTLVFAIALAGCGSTDHPPVGDVSGTVTLDGTPLADATVMFQPESGRASFGTTDQQGYYQLNYIEGVSGALVGKHKVTIRTEVPGEDGQPPTVRERLPKKYHSKSELQADVKSGSNTVDFPLTSK